MAACRLDGFGERGEAFEISLEILLPYLSPFLTFLALKLILVFHISSGIEWGNLSCDDLPGNIRQRECDRPKACSDFAAHEMSSNLRLHLCQIVFLALLVVWFQTNTWETYHFQCCRGGKNQVSMESKVEIRLILVKWAKTLCREESKNEIRLIWVNWTNLLRREEKETEIRLKLVKWANMLCTKIEIRVM